MLAAVVWGSAEEIAGRFDPPCYERSGGAESHQERPGGASAAGEQQAADADAQQPTEECGEPDWWSIPFEGWVALSTVLLFFSTTGLWVATFNLGKHADESMQNLERAYLRVVITNTEELAAMFKAAEDSDDPIDPAVSFKIVNYGKTPADSMSGLMKLEGQAAYGLWPELYRSQPFPAALRLPSEILGANESTPILRCHLSKQMTAVDASKLATNRYGSQISFTLHVTVEYRDVWRNGYEEIYSATYDTFTQTFRAGRVEKSLGRHRGYRPASASEQKWRRFWSRPFSLRQWRHKFRSWRASVRSARLSREAEQRRRREQEEKRRRDAERRAAHRARRPN